MLTTARKPPLAAVVAIVVVLAGLDAFTWFIGGFGCAVGEYDDATSEDCREEPWRWAGYAAIAVIAGGVLTRRLSSWWPLGIAAVLALVALGVGWQ